MPPNYPTDPKTLGEHLLKKRLDLGATQPEVASRISVNVFSLRHWEKGVHQPSLRFLPKIVEFLGYRPLAARSRSLGQRIVNARRLLGLSQKELARKIGVDPSTLWRWERDQRPPAGKYLERIDAVLRGMARTSPPRPG